MMYGISQFAPKGLRICANYRHAFPPLNCYTNKIRENGPGIKVAKNNRIYSTQITNRYDAKSLYKINPSQSTSRNASSLSMDKTRTHSKRRSRKWKYVLGLGGILGGIFFYYTSEDDVDDEPPNSGLRTPSIPSEITKDWIEYMLTEYENRNSKGANVIVKSFETNNALKPGEGLNSQLQKLDVHATVQHLPGQGSASIDKKYHVMIKMRVQSKAVTKEMNRFIDSELKELTLYSRVIPELNKFQENYGNEFRIKVPGFLYGKFTNKESVLVIENLKPAGYKPTNLKKEADLNHAKIVVENLAKLHAVSYSYNRTHHFLNEFPCYGSDKMHWFNTNLTTAALLDNAIKMLELNGDNDSKKLIEKIENSKAKLEKKLNDVVRDDDSKKLLCFTHGDCHNSNLLFKYGEDAEGNQTIDELQFVDWQFANWDSPVIDLQYFFNLCTTHKFKKLHLETLLEHYHSTFIQATNKMGTPISHWTYEEFKEEYNRFAVFGLLRGLLVIQFAHSKFMDIYQSDMLEEAHHGNPRLERMYSKIWKYLFHKCYASPTVTRIINQLQVIALYYIRKEITSLTNPVLNDRILGLVLDADERGLFDDGNSSTK